MKKLCAGIVGFALSGAFAFGGPIIINNATSFTYTQNFSALGNATVTWDDGNTIQGIYLNSVSAGVPESVAAATGTQSTLGAYNMGLSGSGDRALGWLTGSGTGTAYTGIQFRDQTGINAAKTISYSFVLEQWGKRNTSAQSFTLQYKIDDTGGNNLTSADWTTLGSGTTPVIGDGNSPFNLDGNENQFTIAGTTNFSVNNEQFLTFRLVDIDHSGGDAMVGIDSISITVIPEPSTWALLAGSLTFIVLLRRRRTRKTLP
jgi:hypothetical protein